MSVKPILFNDAMVPAILDGRKCVTRRVVKPQPIGRIAYCIAGYKHGTWSYPGDTAYKWWGDEWRVPDGITREERNRHWTSPCHTDDILWVREAWAERSGGYIYKAGTPPLNQPGEFQNEKWRPSIHMPQAAARLWLRVTDVRVQRLQDMTKKDALYEGFLNPAEFIRLWDGTIKPADRDRYGWAASPWVWVIEFERCEKPEESPT